MPSAKVNISPGGKSLTAAPLVAPGSMGGINFFGLGTLAFLPYLSR
jgi:hypothetical protein